VSQLGMFSYQAYSQGGCANHCESAPKRQRGSEAQTRRVTFVQGISWRVQGNAFIEGSA